MIASKIALVSRRIVLEESEDFQSFAPFHGVLLIKDGVIEEILPFSDVKFEVLAQEYILEDLGNLCIFPGIIDLNVNFNTESASTVTKQAISGGVTTIASADYSHGETYTDIAKISILSDLSPILSKSDIFAYKIFLVPQGPHGKILTNLETLPENLPIFIHPELATAEKMYQATPFRLVSPTKRVFDCKIIIHEEPQIIASHFKLNSDDEDSESCSESYSDEVPDIKIQDFSLEIPENRLPMAENNLLLIPEREKKRVSLPTLLGNNLINIGKNSPRHHSVQCVGIQKRPIPIQDIPFINKGTLVEQAYSEHILNFPADWEIAAVQKVLERSQGQFHFSNVSSSKAIEEIRKYSQKATCETSVPYLYFTETDVKPGDTRYKLNPPIRDHANNRNLWQMVRNKEIQCVTSYHQPVPPPLKFIGDFKRAVNGVASIGFNLQALWTRIRAQVPVEHEYESLQMLSKVLSTNPAKILNLPQKGGICKGKHADLIIWDPDHKVKISKSFDRYPEMSPFIGEELYGKIHRTYLRGKLVYSTKLAWPSGEIMLRT